VNLGRLLQSLDDDGNLENGIQITSDAHTAATGLTLDFNVPVATFEANAAVGNLLSSGGGSVTLVSAEDAVAHMQEQAAKSGVSLVGTWYIQHEDELIAISVLPDGKYVIVEDSESGEGGEAGYEYGTYAWDAVTGALTADVLIDDNGEWGLSDPLEGEVLNVARDGDSLTFTEGEDVTTLTRVAPDANNAIVGAWEIQGFAAEDQQRAIVVFLPGGHYVVADVTEKVESSGGNGIEHGTYTWNAETSAFTREVINDTNGDWGFSDDVTPTVEVDGDTMTLTFSAEDVVTLKRLP
jgi:hypothetical protein